MIVRVSSNVCIVIVCVCVGESMVGICVAVCMFVIVCVYVMVVYICVCVCMFVIYTFALCALV